MAISTPSSAPPSRRATSTPPPTTKPARPSQPVYDFAFTAHLQKEFHYGLDPNRPTCKAYLQGHCPLGATCPDKHAGRTGWNSSVCKHWMRGLCKKGDFCEFLHEY